MRSPRFLAVRRLTVVAALALTSMAMAAACGSTAVVRPPAVPSPSTVSPGTETPGTTSPSSATPRAPDATRPPTRPAGCLGAEVYKIDASKDGAAWPSKLCMSVGGELWFQWVGPENLSADSWDNLSCDYEAAVHVCRLIGTGTVRFAVTGAEGVRRVTLTIAEASSPPGPSTACAGAKEKIIINAADHGPSWRAMCVKVGTILRFENHGPDGFAVKPAGLVTCWYEGGVRECRFLKPGTATFTVSNPNEVRPLIVVGIK